MARLELRRIGIFSAVKTMFLLGGAGGFIFGLIEWALLALLLLAGKNMPFGATLFDQAGMGDLMGAGIGALGLLLPLGGGFSGAVGGVVFGFLLSGIYNLGARIWGGLELEWNTRTDPNAAPAPPIAVPGSAPLPVGGGTGLSAPGSAVPETRQDKTGRSSAAMYE